jgi:hypothetical protein
MSRTEVMSSSGVTLVSDHPPPSRTSTPEEKDKKIDEEAHVEEKETAGEDSTPSQQPPAPAPAPKAEDKNPFGLKPEYKTAFRDFLVCCHSSTSIRCLHLVSCDLD